jgi:hypothetical protein
MIIKTTLEDMNEGISMAYENWAKKAGFEVNENTKFDCREIEVSKEIDDYFWKWYTDEAIKKNPNIDENEIQSSLAMMFVCYGAKRNETLKPWTLEIKEGFVNGK